MNLWDDREEDRNTDWEGPEAMVLIGLVCLAAILMFVVMSMFS